MVLRTCRHCSTRVRAPSIESEYWLWSSLLTCAPQVPVSCRPWLAWFRRSVIFTHFTIPLPFAGIGFFAYHQKTIVPAVDKGAAKQSIPIHPLEDHAL